MAKNVTNFLLHALNKALLILLILDGYCGIVNIDFRTFRQGLGDIYLFFISWILLELLNAPKDNTGGK